MRALFFIVAAPFMGCASISNSFLVSNAIMAADRDEIPGAAYSHYFTASVYRREGRLDDAIRELRRAADLAPESRALQTKMIRYYVSAERYDDALKICERTSERYPDDITFKLWQGGILRQLEQYQDAIDVYREAIELNPDDPRIYSDLITVEESINDLTAAIESYETLIERFPNDPRLWFQLGVNLTRINDREAARDAFRTVLALTEDRERKLPRAHYILGVLAMEDGDNETAAEQLTTYLDADPNDVRAHVNLAGVLARLERYDESLDHLDFAVEAEPVPLHHLLRMFLMYRSGKYESGASIIPPNEAPYFGSLLRALFRKELGEAYRPILESMDMFDGDLEYETNNYITEVVNLFGREETGAFLANELRAIQEEGIESKVIDTFLGRTYISLERNREAANLLESVIEKYGPDKAIFYTLASLHEGLDDIDAVERHLKAYLDLDPGNPDALNFLGYMYADENMKLEEAEKLIEEALDQDPENGFYLDSLGWLYYRKGDGEKAVEYIRKAIRSMESDDAILRDHLGDAYRLAGDIEKALGEWRRARRLDPELEGVQEKIDRFSKGTD